MVNDLWRVSSPLSLSPFSADSLLNYSSVLQTSSSLLSIPTLSLYFQQDSYITSIFSSLCFHAAIWLSQNSSTASWLTAPVPSPLTPTQSLSSLFSTFFLSSLFLPLSLFSPSTWFLWESSRYNSFIPFLSLFYSHCCSPDLLKANGVLRLLSAWSGSVTISVLLLLLTTTATGIFFFYFVSVWPASFRSFLLSFSLSLFLSFPFLFLSLFFTHLYPSLSIWAIHKLKRPEPPSVLHSVAAITPVALGDHRMATAIIPMVPGPVVPVDPISHFSGLSRLPNEMWLR